MRKNFSKSLFVLVVFFLAVILTAHGLIQGENPSDPRKKEVDKIFAGWDKPDSPGCALGIIQDGLFIYKRGYGMANLEYGIPLSSQSVFRIGSTSKQFTAMCIVLLEEEGKLSVDDTLKKYFPEMPDYAETITIRHLLHHTSGVRDYLTLMSLQGARGDDFYTDPEVVDLITRQKELNFAPGDEFLYSNSGYFLLAEIVKRVTGDSMRVYAEEKIFKPLGMIHTHFHEDHTQIVKNRASGYGREEDGSYWINMTTLGMIGDGGVFTSVDDLFLWDQNFYDNKLGKEDQSLIERMQIPGILNNGENRGYAFGLGISEYKGLNLVSHGGAFVGFRADMIRFPEQKFSVIVLANLGAINPSRLAKQVADIYLEDFFKPENPTQDVPKKPGEKIEAKSDKKIPREKLNLEQLKAYTGDYTSEELDVTYCIVFKEDKLYLQQEKPYRPYPGGFLVQQQIDRFNAGGIVLDFSRDERNNV
ncbi:MAG: beta-lactamase family protein, partial [Candidatus Aminicenantes bacterium]|nr:beta-lactamase family protein [Candidatus Aminicenantes bacterium]